MQKLRLTTACVLASVMAFTTVSCSKSSGGSSGGGSRPPASINCSGVTSRFAAEVAPIISSSCAVTGCHASGSGNGPGELLTYNQIFNARSSIRFAVVNRIMPKNTSLTDAQINLIACWIDGGAPNN
jgi:hypothetical protein